MEKFYSVSYFFEKFYNVFHFTRDAKVKKTDLEGVFFIKTSFYTFYSVKTSNFALAIQFKKDRFRRKIFHFLSDFNVEFLQHVVFFC